MSFDAFDLAVAIMNVEIIIDTDNEDHDDDDGVLDPLLMLLMMTISRHGQELVKNRFVVRNLNI